MKYSIINAVVQKDLTSQYLAFLQTLFVYSIEVDEALCTVKTPSYSEVFCRTSTSEPSESGIYSGNASLRCQYWDSSSSFSNLIGVVDPHQETVLATPQIKIMNKKASGLDFLDFYSSSIRRLCFLHFV